MKYAMVHWLLGIALLIFLLMFVKKGSVLRDYMIGALIGLGVVGLIIGYHWR